LSKYRILNFSDAEKKCECETIDESVERISQGKHEENILTYLKCPRQLAENPSFCYPSNEGQANFPNVLLRKEFFLSNYSRQGITQIMSAASRFPLEYDSEGGCYEVPATSIVSIDQDSLVCFLCCLIMTQDDN